MKNSVELFQRKQHPKHKFTYPCWDHRPLERQSKYSPKLLQVFTICYGIKFCIVPPFDIVKHTTSKLYRSTGIDIKKASIYQLVPCRALVNDSKTSFFHLYDYGKRLGLMNILFMSVSFIKLSYLLVYACLDGIKTQHCTLFSKNVYVHGS